MTSAKTQKTHAVARPATDCETLPLANDGRSFAVVLTVARMLSRMVFQRSFGAVPFINLNPKMRQPAVRAPDFPEGLDWIHTGGRQLTLADFRGKILLLDFWTYG